VKVVGYARVSTKQQAVSDSIAAQVEAIRKWAGRNGHEVVTVYRDNGKSGMLDAVDRPGLIGALNALEAGHAEALVVHRLDRLARALHVQEAVLSRVWAESADVWEVVGSFKVLRDDPDDPMRTFVRQVMGAAQQLERGMTVARMQGGRRRKSDNGGYVGGIVRYGWRVEGEGRDAVLVEVESEQLVLARMRKLSREDVPLRRIAAMLNEDGVPTRRGGIWRHTTIRSALKKR
jgi:DNA invertase Pin-like site-specific DNA recombinase